MVCWRARLGYHRYLLTIWVLSISSMNILVHTSLWGFWLPNALSLLLILSALVWAPWRELAARSIRVHLLLGAIVILGIFWSWMKVNVHDIYGIHPVLMTTLVVVFGLRLSLLAGALALVWMHILGASPWENIGWHFMVNVVAPGLASRALLYAIWRQHIQNLFIFLLGGGFLGGMLSALSIGASALGFLWLAQSSLLLPVWDNGYLFFMLMFPEGFANGAIVTAIAVLHPELVRSYNDDFYLDGKG